jgi:pimeloyl-ACP methyl ester carboxylesterase
MATFVLVHGAFSGGWKWDEVARYLREKGHTVIAPDLPGHGQDTTPTENVTLQDCANRVAEVIDQQAEPVIFVGHSMGGLVISQTAEQRPEKIKKLVYVCAFLLKDGESLRSKGGGGFNPRELSREEFKERFCADCSDEEVDKSRANLKPRAGNLATTPVHISSERYGRIPRVYIQTLQDRAILPETQKAMYTALPCECVLTMNTSHSPLGSAPKELAEHLDSIT